MNLKFRSLFNSGHTYHQKKSFPGTLLCAAFLLTILVPAYLFASQAHADEGGSGGGIIVQTFLWIAIILMLAKVSSLVEKVGQPAVLGELLIGVLIGSLPIVGIHFLEPILSNEIIHFLAEFGVVILLYQIGMESNIKTMMKVGIPSLLVATLGVIAPFVAITWYAGPWLMPGLSSVTYLFMGATMTATSVGITARVLKDLGKSQTSEARIILGAAVIDDVMGLVILAVVSAIATKGSVGMSAVGIIVLKAAVFLGGGILIGTWLAPQLGRFFSGIHTGIGMKFALVISFGLVFAYIASLMGLAPIVGAFAAGLVLEPVYFNQFNDPGFVDDLRGVMKTSNFSEPATTKLEELVRKHSHRHIEEFTENLGHFVVPIFFVLTGMQVKVQSLFDSRIIIISATLLVIATLAKVVAGVAAGKGVNKLAVGVGMIPRGEVGLIFANIGKGLGIMDDTVFSAIVVVIMLTTLVTPPMLTIILKKVK